LTLQQELRLVHAARHIHRQYEKQVYLFGSASDWNLGHEQRR
jgi:hypothetical protein